MVQHYSLAPESILLCELQHFFDACFPGCAPLTTIPDLDIYELYRNVAEMLSCTGNSRESVMTPSPWSSPGRGEVIPSTTSSCRLSPTPVWNPSADLYEESFCPRANSGWSYLHEPESGMTTGGRLSAPRIPHWGPPCSVIEPQPVLFNQCTHHYDGPAPLVHSPAYTVHGQTRETVQSLSVPRTDKNNTNSQASLLEASYSSLAMPYFYATDGYHVPMDTTASIYHTSSSENVSDSGPIMPSTITPVPPPSVDFVTSNHTSPAEPAHPSPEQHPQFNEYVHQNCEPKGPRQRGEDGRFPCKRASMGCTKTFQQTGNATRHEDMGCDFRTMEEKIIAALQTTCFICNKVYTRVDVLRKHNRKLHPTT